MKTLVESCFILDTKLLKRDLRLAREHKNGIDGFINITRGNKQSAADYYIEYGNEYDYLVVHYGENEQRIKLVEGELHFGTRSWFKCECDRQVGKINYPAASRRGMAGGLS